MYTPVEAIPKMNVALRATFRKHTTRPIAWRQHQVLQVARMVQDNQKLFADALYKDLGRPSLESYAFEITPIIERAMIVATNLAEWAEPDVKSNLSDPHQQAWNPKVYYEPKGVALVIAPWNFPMILSLQPMIGAICAGNACAIKLSEVAPHYATLVAELIPKYMDTSAIQVILGGVLEITKVLELKWDHIFFTGNTAVGRIISAAAAKHLTPVTLELGGKSPVILDPEYSLEVAARRILFGKCVNAGQICVSPDYVLLPTGGNKDVLPRVVDAFRAAFKTFYLDRPSLQSSSFSRIVSQAHYTRVSSLLERTKGTVVIGGERDPERLKIEPTILTGVAQDDAVMESEIFGPVLPILEVDTLEDACEFVADREHPLVVYAFTNTESVKTLIRENTMSGNLVFNDTFIQLAVHDLPFGGVGESGHGRHITQYGFKEFSYMRSSIDMPLETEELLSARYPPYDEEKFRVLNEGVFTKIPHSTPESGVASNDGLGNAQGAGESVRADRL